MNYRIPERLDALAAQYVLGTLRGAARRRFSRLIQADRVVGDAVAAWEERLMPLSVALAPLASPEHVWSAILERLHHGRRSASVRYSLWASLGFWRASAIAGLVLTVVLTGLLLEMRPEAPGQTIVAVLAGQDGKSALVASA